MNFGDCFAYALAKTTGEPLLFKGDDFGHTDIRVGARRRRVGVTDIPDVFRCGFVTMVGRPNVGKSSLVNAICGAKVSIVSDKPQTTRHRVRGVFNRPDAQLVFVDTPGLHKPVTALGRRVNATAIESSPSPIPMSTSCASSSTRRRRSAPATSGSPATSTCPA